MPDLRTLEARRLVRKHCAVHRGEAAAQILRVVQMLRSEAAFPPARGAGATIASTVDMDQVPLLDGGEAFPAMLRAIREARFFVHRRLRQQYLQAISRARRSVRLTQVYFLPDIRLLRALTSAARRAVDVRVLLAGPLDVPVISATWPGVCRRLLRAGVRVFRWTGSVLDAKAGSVDDRLFLVGSFNLDPLSLVNEELPAQATEPATTREFDAWFDRHALLELTLEDCRPHFWPDVLARILSWAGFFIARHLRRRGPPRRRLAFLSSDVDGPLLQGGKS